MTETVQPETQRPPSAVERPSRGVQWTLCGLVLVAGVVLTIGGFGLKLPLNVGYLGPQWFPIGVGVALIVLSGALALQIVREPVVSECVVSAGTDWRSFGVLAATLALHVVAISLVGWIPAGTVLFWGVARAVGSRRTLFDLGVAVVFACAVQFGFSAGLGVALPVGSLLEVA